MHVVTFLMSAAGTEQQQLGSRTSWSLFPQVMLSGWSCWIESEHLFLHGHCWFVTRMCYMQHGLRNSFSLVLNRARTKFVIAFVDRGRDDFFSVEVIIALSDGITKLRARFLKVSSTGAGELTVDREKVSRIITTVEGKVVAINFMVSTKFLMLRTKFIHR